MIPLWRAMEESTPLFEGNNDSFYLGALLEGGVIVGAKFPGRSKDGRPFSSMWHVEPISFLRATGRTSPTLTNGVPTDTPVSTLNLAVKPSEPVNPAAPPAAQRQRATERVLKAIKLLVDDPGRSDRSIAREVGINHGQLSRSTLWKDALKMSRGSKADLRAGFRDGETGTLHAVVKSKN